MSTSNDRVPVAGSHRDNVPGARAVGYCDPAAHLEVTLLLRPAHASAVSAHALGAQPLQQRRYQSREELAAQRGAAPADVAAVESFAARFALTVTRVSLAERTVILDGSVEQLSAAFGVELREYDGPSGRYRGRTGPVHVPRELGDIIVGVFGLDDRPQLRPHFRVLTPEPAPTPPAATAHVSVVATAEATRSFTPVEIAALYQFPTDVTGRGQCIGLIELGGGYRQSDLTTYFQGLNLPVPSVTAVSIQGAKNQPTTPDSADGEVLLDIEVAGAIAPAAQIVVYFAPNTDQGFLNAINAAIHDSAHNPTVISISWGAPEALWTKQALQAMDQVFQDAAQLGVTVYCAAGDNGANDGMAQSAQPDQLAHADFPAASPSVIGCGGTLLDAAGGAITAESVWNDGAGGGATGGGVSDVFPLPDYQGAAHVPASINPGAHAGRGVPDVSGNASPRSGYQVLVDGQAMTIGGTSAVAPLWAGLTALLNEALGTPLGFWNPLLYQQLASQSVCRDITQGDNDLSGTGGYAAGPGWDACTGWGSPNGAALLAALRE